MAGDKINKAILSFLSNSAAEKGRDDGSSAQKENDAAERMNVLQRK